MHVKIERPLSNLSYKPSIILIFIRILYIKKTTFSTLEEYPLLKIELNDHRIYYFFYLFIYSITI